MTMKASSTSSLSSRTRKKAKRMKTKAILSTSAPWMTFTKQKRTPRVLLLKKNHDSETGTNIQTSDQQQQIAKLCDSLSLPDNVRCMVRKFLEFTINNFKNCTEPISILQDFQLSLTTSSELSSEAAVGMPNLVRSTNYPENATLNSSLSVNSTESQEHVQVQPLSLVESPPSPIISLPATQSDHFSMVTKLQEQAQEQAQKLPSSGFLSSNKGFSTLPSLTGVEDRVVTNAGALSSKIPVTSTVIQNPAVEQPASNLEVGSQSRQVVSNMAIDSLVPGGIRARSSETRNPGLRNHPIEAAPQSSVMNLPPLYHNPLCHELERIQKIRLLLKCKFQKEIDELRLKYAELHKECERRLPLKWVFENQIKILCNRYGIELNNIEVEFQRASESYDAQYKIVHVHKRLADAMSARSKLEFFSAPQMLQDSGLTHQSRQLNVNSISLPSGNRQVGPETHTPALHGMPIHHAHSNSPASSSSLSHGLSRAMSSTISQVSTQGARGSYSIFPVYGYEC